MLQKITAYSLIKTLKIKTKLQLVVLSCTLIACAPMLYFFDTGIGGKLGLVATIGLLTWFVSDLGLRRFDDGLSALETGLLNFVDGEFSSLLAYDDNDQLGELCQLYNQTADKLRAEKHWIYQRELMLDKVLQNSPEVLLLVNDHGQVVFSNWAARHFFSSRPEASSEPDKKHNASDNEVATKDKLKSNTKLEGISLSELLEYAPEGAAEALRHGKEGLFSLAGEENEQQTWHLGSGQFLLNNQRHMLYIMKQMTRELSRLEVAVWKKVIRIISHELNNSLGPISSMLHSGKLLTQQVDDNRLNRVFDTIEERIQHLITFVQGYGKFAKLPEPKISSINPLHLIETLAQQWQFTFNAPSNLIIKADPIQLEQLLINLLKNARMLYNCVWSFLRMLKELPTSRSNIRANACRTPSN